MDLIILTTLFAAMKWLEPAGESNRSPAAQRTAAAAMVDGGNPKKSITENHCESLKNNNNQIDKSNYKQRRRQKNNNNKNKEVKAIEYYNRIGSRFLSKVPRVVLRMRSEVVEKRRWESWPSPSSPSAAEEEGRSEMKWWRKSKGVTARNLQLRIDITQSSILWTVLGSKTNLGSKIWRSKINGTWGSSIFAAKDKHATDRSWNAHTFRRCK